MRGKERKDDKEKRRRIVTTNLLITTTWKVNELRFAVVAPTQDMLPTLQ